VYSLCGHCEVTREIRDGQLHNFKCTVLSFVRACLPQIGQLGAASECFKLHDKVFAFLAMSAHSDQLKVNYDVHPCYLFWNVVELFEIDDIHFQEISSLQRILNLEWHILLKVINELVLTDPELRAIRLPCHLDCGILSMKRERVAKSRRSCTARSYLTNCWFKKDFHGDTRQIMVQLQLAQSANGTFRVTEAAYCLMTVISSFVEGLGSKVVKSKF